MSRKVSRCPDGNPEKARALKYVLALLCSVKAPTYYLAHNRAALRPRCKLFRAAARQDPGHSPGISPNRSNRCPSSFSIRPPQDVALPHTRSARRSTRSGPSSSGSWACPACTNSTGCTWMLKARSIRELQNSVINLFKKLHDPKFLDSAGLRGTRLLESGRSRKR